MSSIVSFIKEFKEGSGFNLFFTTILDKLVNFILTWSLIYTIDKSLLGQFTYAQSVMFVFYSLLGFGSNSALLQYGAKQQSISDKFNLVSYTFTRGLQLNLILMVIAVVIGIFLSEDNNTLLKIMILLSVQILSLFLSRFQQTYYRLSFLNKTLSEYETLKSVALLIVGLIGIYFYGVYGYLITMIVIPILLFVIQPIPFPIRWSSSWKLSQITASQYWKYSVYSSFATLIAQLVFVVDAIIIFQMLGDEPNAEYRVASIIPFNLLFLPVVFMKTDFAKLAKHSNKVGYLRKYYLNYSRLFVLIGMSILVVGYTLGPHILKIFGSQYSPFSLFIILLWASVISMILRIPLGNIIAAAGKPNINMYNAFITIALDVGLNYVLITSYGLIGAAYATAFSLIFSGVLSLICFLWITRPQYLTNSPSDTH